MKHTVVLLLVLFLSMASNISSQNLTKAGFESILCPQYMGSGSSARLPVIYCAKLTGLTANTTYRYYTQAAISADIGGTSTAGTSMLISMDGQTFTYTTSPGMTSIYETFTTNSSGEYTGWFCFSYTSNTRFTAGNYILPALVIGSNSGTTLFRRALNDSIKVLAFNTSAGANNGTGVYGISLAAPKNIIALYDNTSGTGKPITLSYTESEGATIASSVGFYTTNVDSKEGRWGTIIPNTLSTGIKRIEVFSILTRASIDFTTDSDGIWPSGLNTVNPTGGSTAPLVISALDAPLPVYINNFSYLVSKSVVVLSWQTGWEINNRGFEVQRRTMSGDDWTSAGFVNGAGNSAENVNYSFADNVKTSGKYEYRLKQIDFNSEFGFYNLKDIVTISKPAIFQVSQNYPNPSNPASKIDIDLPAECKVTLRLYDITGKEAALIFEGIKPAGYQSIAFDGKDLASGIYFYTISAVSEAGSFSKTMKLVLVK